MKDGDIVVRTDICTGSGGGEMTIGGMYKINRAREFSLEEHTGYWDREKFRLASPLEIYNYTKGIRSTKNVKMPELWAIQVTRQSDLVCDWFLANRQNNNTKRYQELISDNEYLHYPMIASHGRNSHRGFQPNLVEKGYTAISIEDFKTYLLNTQPKVIVIPEITIFGEKVDFIKQSIQFGDTVLTLNDLEAIKKIQKACKEHELELDINDKTIVIKKFYDNGSNEEPFNELDTIIKTLKETNEDTKILAKGF